MQVPSSFLTDTFEPRSVLETAVIVRKESGQRFRLSIPFQVPADTAAPLWRHHLPACLHLDT